MNGEIFRSHRLVVEDGLGGDLKLCIEADPLYQERDMHAYLEADEVEQLRDQLTKWLEES